jgi:hypothetical protein
MRLGAAHGACGTVAKTENLDGKAVPVEFHTTRIDFEGSAAIYTVIHDITDRKLRSNPNPQI